MNRTCRAAVALGSVIGVAFGAGAVSTAAWGQTSGAPPQGASVESGRWCRVALEPDSARFQQRVVSLLASGGQVVGTSVVIGEGSRTYFYALVCGPAADSGPPR